MPEWIKNITPMIGVLLGAFLQYWFSKSSEGRKHQINLRTQAYVDFLRAVAGRAIAQKSDDKDKEKENRMLMADSKVRISVYGSKKVIESLSNFIKAGEKFSTPEGIESFTSLIQTIRQESLKQKITVIDNELSILLFGLDPRGIEQKTLPRQKT